MRSLYVMSTIVLPNMAKMSLCITQFLTNIVTNIVVKCVASRVMVNIFILMLIARNTGLTNCDSSNVAYLLECMLCGVQYVGGTCMPFKISLTIRRCAITSLIRGPQYPR